MITEHFISIFKSLSPSLVTDVFTTIIVLTALAAVHYHRQSAQPGFVNAAPSLLTSIGILGTFLGVVLGLLEFDVKSIDASIETLLGGLKTAFITSLFGMAASIALKIILPLLKQQEVVSEDQAVGPDQIYSAIKKQGQALDELVNAIGGDKDSSMVSQLRLLRSDVSDGTKVIGNKVEEGTAQTKELEQAHQANATTLWSKMDDFSEMLSKSATEQVINALKEVIVEFNDNLTEQFGENFKRLDESVKKLVDWQENYRLQLEDMATKYQLGVDAISHTEQSVANIGERAESIPATMEKLHTVMELGHGQVTELSERLEAFKDLRDKAVEAMPQIREQLDNTMGEISSSVKAASEHYERMLGESKEVIVQFTKAQEKATTDFTAVTKTSLGDMKESITDGVKDVSKTLIDGASDIGGKLAQSSQDITDNVTKASGALNTTASEVETQTAQIKQHLQDTMSELNAEVRDLVKNLKEESANTGRILVDSNTELSGGIKQIHTEMTSAIGQLQARLETTLEEIFRAQTQAVGRTFDSLEDQIVNTVGRTGQAVEKQVSVLDEQMQQEINRVINEMGTALATVTQQFTRDYTRLVTEMGKVVANSRMAS